MANNITTTFLFGDDIVFRWKAVDNSNFYRVVLQSTTIILDTIISKDELVSGQEGFLEFILPKDSFSVQLIPLHVFVSTIDVPGIYTAQATFILLGKRVKDEFDDLQLEIEKADHSALTKKLNSFLTSALKSPEMFGQVSKDITFLPGSLLLELSLDSSSVFLNSSISTNEIFNTLPTASLMSISGTGPTPPPPPTPHWPR